MPRCWTRATKTTWRAAESRKRSCPCSRTSPGVGGLAKGKRVLAARTTLPAYELSCEAGAHGRTGTNAAIFVRQVPTAACRGENGGSPAHAETEKQIRDGQRKTHAKKRACKRAWGTKNPRNSAKGGCVCVFVLRVVGKSWDGVDKKTYDFDGVDGVRWANQRARDGSALGPGTSIRHGEAAMGGGGEAGVGERPIPISTSQEVKRRREGSQCACICLRVRRAPNAALRPAVTRKRDGAAWERENAAASMGKRHAAGTDNVRARSKRRQLPCPRACSSWTSIDEHTRAACKDTPSHEHSRATMPHRTACPATRADDVETRKRGGRPEMSNRGRQTCKGARRCEKKGKALFFVTGKPRWTSYA